jgi:hypothetical protein
LVPPRRDASTLPGPLERAPNQKALIANIPKVDFDSVEVPLTEGFSSRM